MSGAAQRLFFALGVKPFLVLFIGLRVSGREHLPASDPFILVANHSSHLDTASLLALFPAARLRSIRPVAAADYFERTRFRAWVSRTFFNILPIARGRLTPETNPLPKMLAALEAGESLIVFPEGTRGGGDEVGHFKSGIAHLVERAPQVPVVPAYLRNMGARAAEGGVGAGPALLRGPDRAGAAPHRHARRDRRGDRGGGAEAAGDGVMRNSLHDFG